MTLSHSKFQKAFKHPLVVELIVVAIVAIMGSYLTILQASIPRSEAEFKIQQSENKQMNAIDKFDRKQDEILNKLENLQVEVGIIKGKLEGSEKRK